MAIKHTSSNKFLICGYGLACAEIVRLHGEPTIAADVINASGFNLEDFRAAGLDQYDLDEIEKLFNENVALSGKIEK